MLKDKTLLGLVIAVILMMVGVGMIVAVLPQRVVEFDGHGRSVGYLASAFAISYLILQLPLGRLSDKIGFKQLLVMGYLLCFLTGVVFFFAKSSKMIFFARFLQGMGEAPVWASAPALLSLRFPLAKGKAIGIYNSAFHFALTLGPFWGVLLLKVLKTYEIFLVYSLACFAGAIVIYFMVEPPIKQTDEVRQDPLDYGSIITLLKKQDILVSFTGIIIYGAGYGIFLTTIPAFLLQEKAFNEIGISLFFSMFYIAISTSQAIIGPILDRFRKNLFMIFGLLIVAVGIITAPAFNFPWILLILTVASLGLGVFYLASMTFINESVPDSQKGTISGLYYLFWGIGMFFGPPIMTKVSTSFNFSAAMGIYSLIILMVVTFNIRILVWNSHKTKKV